MSTSTTKTVQDLKTELGKQLPCDSPAKVERARDILQRLDETDITLEVLRETLVGTVVTKVKSHDELGDAAKKLIKKWKKLAKAGGVSSSAPPARMESTMSAASNIAEDLHEWADLPSFRKNICNKLHGILELSKPDLKEWNDSAVSQLCVSRASEIEGSMHIALQEKSPYLEKARTLCFNLKKNKDLRESVLLGMTSSQTLVKMSSDQMATRQIQQARLESVQKLEDSRRLDWEQANEAKINEMCGIKGELLSASLFTCGRCKSTKTTSTQKQTRSADEPMTVFVLCMNCGKRWKC